MTDLLLNQRTQARLISAHTFNKLDTLFVASLELMQNAVHRSLLFGPILMFPFVVGLVLLELFALGLLKRGKLLVQLACFLLGMLEFISQLRNRAKFFS